MDVAIPNEAGCTVPLERLKFYVEFHVETEIDKEIKLYGWGDRRNGLRAKWDDLRHERIVELLIGLQRWIHDRDCDALFGESPSDPLCFGLVSILSSPEVFTTLEDQVVQKQLHIKKVAPAYCQPALVIFSSPQSVSHQL